MQTYVDSSSAPAPIPMTDGRRHDPATPSAGSRRILLVDDSPDDAAATREVLSALGWDSAWAATYDRGLEALDATSFAAVLLDYHLGDRNGIEFAFEAMRRDVDAPIVLLTAESGEEVVAAAARIGALGYLVKGTYDVPMLERTLLYAIEHCRVQREVATRARHQVAVAELSRCALRAATVGEVFEAAMVALAEVTRATCCELLELVGPHRLERRAGFGDLPPAAVRIDSQPRSLTDFIFACTEPVVIDDLLAEARFSPSRALFDRGVRSGVCAPLHGRQRPHGVLKIFADTPGRFTAADVLFVHSVAQLLSTAIQRYESEAEARAVFNGALDAMAIVDDVANILEVNDAACALFGMAREELVGRRALSLSTGLSEAALQALWSTFVATGKHRGEYCFVNAAGEPLVIEISATAHIRPGQHFAVMRDVTEKRRAEQELRRSEASFRQFLEAAPDAIIAVRDSRLLYGNPRASEMFGYSRDELIGLKTATLVVPEERERVFAVTPDVGVGESLSMDWTCQRKDGSRVAVESNIIRCLLDGEPALLSYCRDVTERKRAAAALRRSEANFRTLIERSPDGILVQRDDRIVYANPVLVRLLGYESAAELIGKSSLALVHPDDVAAVAADRCVPEVSSCTLELRLATRQGSWIWCETKALPLLFDGQPSRTIVIRDVTERKQLHSRLMVADRMVTVGTLSAGVAHEINNPLAYVTTNLEFVDETAEALLTSLPAEQADELRAALSDARHGCKRIGNIVRDLKTLSRGDDDTRSLIDVRDVLDSSIRMASNEIRHRATLVKRYASDLPSVAANEGRLGQVFVNLLVNAAQAVADGRADDNRITVEALGAGGKVVVKISDTGSGIPREALGRIFDAFYTTKPIGVGTGLGLAMCERIVGDLSGHIGVETEVGCGSTFAVTLPAAARGEAATSSPTPGVRTPHRRGRVLVIDDEVAVAKAIRRALQAEHDVVAVHRTEEALARLTRGEGYDVILCDLMMPQVNGPDLFAALSARAPASAERVIFMTGGAFSAEVQAFLAGVPNPRIDKPFDVGELRALVRGRVQAPAA